MFKKTSKTQSFAKSYSYEEVKATPEIIEKFTKVAKDLKKISKKSDDFLYFSIVFLKSAESCLIGKDGLPAKNASGEPLWGYFDEKWKWHGNVMPHKNNNSDIFPESELKKAAAKWVGMPLCRDHESSSVDGIRGIILDTHYDEKYKQVVGLCALDKVNYPDLARKVETGLVRYGSMGTAVEQSICTTCGNIAKTATEYCEHVTNRSAHGEINVGLNPIEYSLVVTPAEPEAVLLKCIASLKKYENDFKKVGVNNIDSVLGKLSIKQAEHLDRIMKTACGGDSCSVEKRDNIVKSFLSNNGLLKVATEMPTQEDTAFSDSHLLQNFVANEKKTPDEEKEVLSNMISSNTMSNIDPTLSAVGKRENLKNNIKLALKELQVNKKQLEQRRQMRRKLAYHQGGADGVEPNTYKSEQFGHDHDKHMKQEFRGGATGLEGDDLSKKEKLSRAALKRRKMRRLAYMQGGSEGAEPNTYKSEQFGHDHDKHMKQEFRGGTAGLEGDDLSKKEKLSRAALKRRQMRKASNPVYRTKVVLAKDSSGRLDKANSVFKVYAGDSLIIRKRAGDIWGKNIDKRWDWFASKEYGKEVIKRIKRDGVTKIASIYKKAQELPPPPPLEGAEDAGAELPPPPDLGGAEDADAGAELPPPPDLGGAEGAEDADMDMEAEEENPSEKIDENLAEIESLLDEIKDLKDQLQDSKSADIDVSFQVGEGDDVKVDSMEALASDMYGQLTAIASELDDSADEMAMVSETYDNINKLSRGQRRHFVKLANEAEDESNKTIGEARALCKMARKTLSVLTKSAGMHSHYAMGQHQADAKDENDISDKKHEHMMSGGKHYAKDGKHENEGSDHNFLTDDENDLRNYADDPMHGMVKDQEHSLESKAMAMRRQRRSQLFKKSQRVATMNKTASEKTTTSSAVSEIKSAFTKKVDAEKMDNYKIKLRRAYDVALTMQKKGFIGATKTALDKQVDEIMSFDDKAFEAFKRTIASANNVGRVKVNTDLGGINVGYSDSQISKQASTSTKQITANLLSSMWDK